MEHEPPLAKPMPSQLQASDWKVVNGQLLRTQRRLPHERSISARQDGEGHGILPRALRDGSMSASTSPLRRPLDTPEHGFERGTRSAGPGSPRPGTSPIMDRPINEGHAVPSPWAEKRPGRSHPPSSWVASAAGPPSTHILAAAAAQVSIALEDGGSSSPVSVSPSSSLTPSPRPSLNPSFKRRSLGPCGNDQEPGGSNFVLSALQSASGVHSTGDASRSAGVDVLSKDARHERAVARPSNRSEAVQLAESLERKLKEYEHDHRATERTWQLAFAEVVRQVYVHCAERGVLLDRVRRWYDLELSRVRALARHSSDKERKLRETIRAGGGYSLDELDSSSSMQLSSQVRSRRLVRILASLTMRLN
jgi:hypothetical protein